MPVIHAWSQHSSSILSFFSPSLIRQRSIVLCLTSIFGLFLSCTVFLRHKVGSMTSRKFSTSISRIKHSKSLVTREESRIISYEVYLRHSLGRHHPPLVSSTHVVWFVLGQIVQLANLSPSAPRSHLQDVHPPDLSRRVSNNHRLPILIRSNVHASSANRAVSIVRNNLNGFEAPHDK